MSYKIGKISLFDAGKSSTSGDVFILPKQNNADGDFFGLIAARGNTAWHHSLINNAWLIAKDAFNDAAIQEPEKRLESALQAVNEQLPQLSKESWEKISGSLNCCFGLTTEDDIYFAIAGSVKVYLVKANFLKDLSEDEGSEPRTAIFDHTLSGKIKDQDCLLITTNSLTDYLALEKIKKIITTLPLHNAVAHLNNILEAVPASTSFFSLIIKPKIQTSNNPTVNPVISTGSKNSLDQMLENQNETAKILTPPNLADTLKQHFLNKWQNKLSSGNLKTKATTSAVAIKTGATSFAHYSVIFGKKVAHAAKITWQHPVTRALLRRLEILARPAKRKFSTLNKMQKTLVIGAAIFILLLAQGLIWQNQKITSLKNTQTYDAIVTEIEDKLNSAETAIIYDNTVSAKQLLNDSDTLIASLPTDNKSREKKLQEIKNRFQTLTNKVWKINDVPAPEVVNDFKDINSLAETRLLGLKNDIFYAFTNINQVFAYNVKDASPLLFDNFEQVNKISFFDKAGALIVATNDNKFYKIDQNEKTPIDIELPKELQKIDDFAFYGNFIYLLDKQAGQIFKLSHNNNKFVSPSSWLKEKISLNETISMAVDGAVMLLQNNGSIIKLRYGKKETFAMTEIFPKVTSPIKILTSEALNNIYLLDKNTNRLIVIAKDGKIVAQYRSNQFNDLKDLVVKEKEKTVYLLNGSQILKIAL